ncbi:MAG TPA: hypothetical protein PKE26_01610 [Kiritimatiellia bacterium]|nr:hypothetical protein [Kiritimatiellia bacterium]HMO97786.1 hypothetical protein [Kiritimatiellia bacterium]HMP91112.1 hypothetical protein [Kiritimatiellia bacterium]
MNKRHVILFVLGLLVNAVYGENLSDGEWRHRIEAADFPSIVSILRLHDGVWPHLSSRELIELQPEATRQSAQAWHGLAQSMLNKLQVYDDAVSATNMFAAIRLYAEFAGAMRSRGGYSNYLLANTAETLAVGHLSASLATNPENYAPVKTAFAELVSSDVPDEVMQDVFREEISAPKVDVSPQTPLSFVDMLKMLDLDRHSFFLRGSVDALSTRQLFAKRDLTGLLWRWVNYSTATKMHIPGYLAFLERGGRYTDALIADASEWNEKMGSIEKDFGCSMLGIPALRPSHIGAWLKSCGNGYSRTPYYVTVFK